MFAILAACASPVSRTPLDSLPPDYVRIPGLTSLPQGPTRYDCGPEVLSCVFRWYGKAISVETISAEIFDPRLKGTVVYQLLPYIRSNGFEPRLVPNATLAHLKAAVREGRPPIIMVRFPKDIYHFFVVTGYSDRARIVTFADYPDQEGQKAAVMDYDRLKEWWGAAENFMLEITPARASVARAAELELNGKWREAASAYEQVLAEDPRDVRAWIGLGNVRYFLGDRAGAADAFRKAMEISPDEPQAMNNLAHVLGEQGRWDDALAMAEHATAIYRASEARLRKSLADEGNPHVREYFAEQARRRRRDLALALGTLGDALHALGRCAEAADAFGESEKLASDPQLEDLPGIRGLAERRAQQKVACRQHASSGSRQ